MVILNLIILSILISIVIYGLVGVVIFLYYRYYKKITPCCCNRDNNEICFRCRKTLSFVVIGQWNTFLKNKKNEYYYEMK